MGFDAGRSVAKLDWTFEPYLQVQGTIPEPSQTQLEEFLDKLASAVQMEVPEGESADAAEVRDAIHEALSDDGFLKQFWPKVLEALEVVCVGDSSPNREQIEQLPARPRLAFFEWISEELTNPTKPNAASGR